MSHNHEHHHHHSAQIESLSSAFIIGIILNSLFLVVEFILGLVYNSIGLVSDAGHNLTDVVSLVLALLAYSLTKVSSNKKFTYGYKKTSILVSLINAIILFVAVIFIVYESVEKMLNPIEIKGGVISITAGIGVVINGITAWLFVKDKEKDLNVKGAYLHMAADALVSIGVVLSGIIITLTGWYIIDGIIGIVVAVIIIVATWDLLNKSVRLSIDGVPAGIDFNHIADTISQTEGVKEVHHLHIWAISTRENALTAHIVVDNIEDMEEIKHEIKHRLEHENITHSTLEFENTFCHCEEHNLLIKE